MHIASMGAFVLNTVVTHWFKFFYFEMLVQVSLLGYLPTVIWVFLLSFFKYDWLYPFWIFHELFLFPSLFVLCSSVIQQFVFHAGFFWHFLIPQFSNCLFCLCSYYGNHGYVSLNFLYLGAMYSSMVCVYTYPYNSCLFLLRIPKSSVGLLTFVSWMGSTTLF